MSSNKKAVFWSGLEKVGSYAANFIIQIVLARLLCPDDYAVVAMLAIFMSVAQVFIDGGFATVLIQKKDCSQDDYSSVFYFNILVSICLYLLLFISAPYVENFYKFQGLAKVLRFYSLTLVINSFAMVNRLLLIKQLKFNVIAVINICATIISAISPRRPEMQATRR
jgi:O-antigen/teichoic acid export membrane protein